MSDTNDWIAPRSLLFVPGDSERKQVKALTSGADALILDLEDSVAEDRLPRARQQVREFLGAPRQPGSPQLWVRVNPLSGGKLLHDLRAILAGRPDGIVLPKVSTPEEVIEVGHYLSALEVREDHELGSTKIIVIATETPSGVLNLPRYSPPIARLVGMTWGVEDLSAALGASADASSGALAPVAQLAQSACLLAANAVQAAAFDSVYVQFRDTEGLEREAQRARQCGFVGKLAIHPDQVGPINEAFAPSAEEVRDAQRVVDAFAAAPSAGVVSLDGRMLDKPHLLRARRLLSRARRGT
ncbi:MAG TPA: CoA ester lyase [Steroidobacter sp.]